MDKILRAVHSAKKIRWCKLYSTVDAKPPVQAVQHCGCQAPRASCTALRMPSPPCKLYSTVDAKPPVQAVQHCGCQAPRAGCTALRCQAPCASCTALRCQAPRASCTALRCQAPQIRLVTAPAPFSARTKGKCSLLSEEHFLPLLTSIVHLITVVKYSF